MSTLRRCAVGVRRTPEHPSPAELPCPDCQPPVGTPDLERDWVSYASVEDVRNPPVTATAKMESMSDVRRPTRYRYGADARAPQIHEAGRAMGRDSGTHGDAVPRARVLCIRRWLSAREPDVSWWARDGVFNFPGSAYPTIHR